MQYLRPWLSWLLVLASTPILIACADVPVWMMLQQRATISDYLHFDNAPITRAPQASVLPVAYTNELNFPAPRWGSNFEEMLARSDTVAFVIVQQDRIVYEKYFGDFNDRSLISSFSMAKSVISALVGIAVHEGMIHSVEDPVTRYFPELLAQDARFAQVRLRHLMEMRSGVAFQDESRMPWGDPARFYLTRDLTSQVRRLRIERPADAAYHYSNADTQLLAMALERAVGVPLARYAQERLWWPMGAASDASWSLDSRDHATPKAFCCLNATARDYARLGLVFLNQGHYNGHQVVPADWIEQSLKVRQHSDAHGNPDWNIDLPGKAFYTWNWRRQPATYSAQLLESTPGPNFYAQGLYGQYIFVAPEQKMVIVRLGRNNGGQDWPRLLGRLARLNPVHQADSKSTVAQQ